MKTQDLLPFLLPDLPGAPDALVKQHLVQATIEFCTETLAWEQIGDSLKVLEGRNELEVETPTDSRIVTVKDIWEGSRRLRPVTMSQLFEALPNWQTAEGSEPTYYNASTDWQTIRIFPKPLNSQGKTLRMRAAFAPKLTATTLPDEIVTKYIDGLTGGAKARLMAIPGKAWTNLQMAAFYRGVFENFVMKAKIDILHDRVQGSLSVRPHPFA
jgi:hypothetical protein